MNISFLTGGEIAALLHISKSMAYRLMQSGQLPTVKIGRVIRVRVTDLEYFIEKNTQAGITEQRTSNSIGETQ